jgi:hypothetical protein
MNWSIIDAGSFDYAADAWGYTDGAAVEWYQDWWTIRSGLFDLSKTPNSKALDPQFFDQYQFDEELEERHALFGQPGKLKLLGFLSHGRMGSYNEATAIVLQTGLPADIAAVRKSHNKSGFSLNLEQQLADDIGMFERAGWSQGQYEAFEFTDINKTVSFGLSLTGQRWGRPDDTVGVALAVNEASSAAKRFFAAGGLGILVGDGRLLRSGPESIFETLLQFCGIQRCQADAGLSIHQQSCLQPRARPGLGLRRPRSHRVLNKGRTDGPSGNRLPSRHRASVRRYHRFRATMAAAHGGPSDQCARFGRGCRVRRILDDSFRR